MLYGYMLGALGLGAILGSVLVRRVQARWGASGLISAAAGLLAACLLALGLTGTLWVAFPALLLSGGCWIGVLATTTPRCRCWCRTGSRRARWRCTRPPFSAGWRPARSCGAISPARWACRALAGAGVMLGLTVLLLYRSRLPEQVDAQSLTRADSAEPALQAAGFDTEHGAVLVAVQYQIPNDKLRALIGAAHPLRLMRLRNGAQQWQLFRDLEREGVWREVFLVESWMQYLRMLDRMTLADKMVLDGVRALHAGDAAPEVSRNVSYGDERVAGILAAAGSGIAVGRAARACPGAGSECDGGRDGIAVAARPGRGLRRHRP